ncbi:unnamed protein product [Pleuronectes platessa]|uniref:Uncharacterized protein n=1 Tax=Pleuronectes platessa TaxID=8262 RepID=A0A9N7VFZ2_PLEPL|nr:unnamed protein product [Pleuronectes platessa]
MTGNLGPWSRHPAWGHTVTTTATIPALLTVLKVSAMYRSHCVHHLPVALCPPRRPHPPWFPMCTLPGANPSQSPSSLGVGSATLWAARLPTKPSDTHSHLGHHAHKHIQTIGAACLPCVYSVNDLGVCPAGTDLGSGIANAPPPPGGKGISGLTDSWKGKRGPGGRS